MIFSQITDQRDDVAVLEHLATRVVGSGIQQAIFTTYQRGQELSTQSGMLQNHKLCSQIWLNFRNTARIPWNNSIKSTTFRGHLEESPVWYEHFSGADSSRSSWDCKKIGQNYGGMQPLITGSQQLVGGTLYLLRTPRTSEINKAKLESNECFKLPLNTILGFGGWKNWQDWQQI